MMQFPVKILSFILFFGVVSPLGAVFNPEVIVEHRPEKTLLSRIFQKQTTEGSNQVSDKLAYTSLLNSNTPIHNIFKTSSLDEVKPSERSNEAPLPRITTIRLLGAYQQDEDSSESKLSNTIAGIDGTGGKPSPNNGIDGTGGNPSPNNGIDGTAVTETLADDCASNGTCSNIPCEDSHDCNKPPRCAPDCTKPLHIIAVLGELQKQEGRFIVNGVTFLANDTTQTMIDGDEEPSAAALNSGQVVTIHGRVDENNQGFADKVTHTTQISGKISHASIGSITVLGQKVVFHSEIIFGGDTTHSSLLNGEGRTVNVSGFRLSNGDFSATRIDLIDDVTESSTEKLTGPISEHSEENKTFVINGVIVNYDQIDDMSLSHGVIVLVEGIADDNQPSDLNAIAIEVVKPIIDEDIEKLVIEGFVTKLLGDSNFTVGDIAIYTDYATDYGEHDQKDLMLDAKVEVEAEVDPTTGLLVANKVTFKVAHITSHKYAALTNHASGPISSSTETFEWKDVGADAYRISIYQGGSKIFYDKTFDGGTTEVTINGLPETSAEFVVELYTLQGDLWSRKVYHHTGPSLVDSSELTSHQFGETLTSDSATFTWSHVPDAESYRFLVYNHQSQIIYFDKTFAEPEAVTLYDLPINHADMTVEVFTLYNGWWSKKDYYVKSVKLKDNAILTSHIDKARLSGSTQTFIWDDVGAEQYELRIARRVINGWFSILQLDTFDSSTTSAVIHDLPINSGDVYVRLRTKHNNGWGTKYYTFPGVGIIAEAELTSHAHKSVLSSTSVEFTWTEVPEAEAYQITIRNHIADYGVRFTEDYNPSVTSVTINDLPENSGEILFTLSTKHNGYWAHKNYTIIGSDGTAQNAKFTSHTHDYQKITSSSTTLTWNDVGADAYQIKVYDHSTPARITIYDQVYGPETTSITLDDLPNNAELKMSVYTKHGDWWATNSIRVITEFP